MGKVFTSEVAEITAETVGEEYPYDFTFDGRLVHYRAPGSGEALLLVAVTGRHVSLIAKLGAVVDLFATVLSPRDKDYILDAIYEDRLGPKTMFGENGDDGILADMLSEWSGRPTKA